VDEKMGDASSSAAVRDEGQSARQTDRSRKRKKRKAKKRQKDLERLQEWVESGTQDAEQKMEGKYEMDEEEDASQLDLDTVVQELPVRLVGDPELASAYARRLAAVRASRGFVSYDTFRGLSRLIEADALALEASGRDWASTYQKLEHLEVLVCIDDADPRHGDDGGEDDDGNAIMDD
jgi:hypothetical protein